jgi:hypothetical protein
MNIFGLFRRYHSVKPPSHDPEEHVDLQGIYDGSALILGNTADLTGSRNIFSPYPNRNSFLLGDWQWNYGNQKSQDSFSRLVQIVGSPDFNPDDVRHTHWPKIDAQLASNPFDSSVIETDETEWVDDAGWLKNTIKISVPFHNRAKNPGTKDYTVGELYHRSLLSLLREKLSNPQDNLQFHYEPFKLWWKSPIIPNTETRVHGELYTSPTFVDAHREVQGLPAEPGCNLPRVVAAMMFWSDATHLTAFGNAKLWPLYMCFGNESKYRRCKPVCHLFNHVAYFQTVSSSFIPCCLS